MNDNRPIFSKTLKKNLTSSYKESVNKSVESKVGIPDSLKNFVTETDEVSYIVSTFDQSVFFPVNFRSALKSDYSLVVGLYEEGIELHNKYIAGCRFPDDGFEWFNQSEISDFQSRLYSEFSYIGKALAHKKRRKSAYEAQSFLFKNVTSPLDKFTWQEGCRLDFLFQHSIDVLVQSYLSEFVNGVMHFPAKYTPDYCISIDYKKLCKTPSEASFLAEQIALYNVQDYVLAESAIEELSSTLVNSETESVINHEDLLFDIYELIPLYIKSWSPDKNKIVLNEQLAIFLTMDYGFPSFVLGKPEGKAENYIASTFRFSWSVTNEFRCWAKSDAKSEVLTKLGNYVLREFHDRLVSLFAIRKSEAKKDDSIHNNDDYLYQVADFTTKYYQVLNEGVIESQDTDRKRHHVPSMSMSSFFTFMQKAFDCKIDNGKGSEMKIWRSGTKIYTLGRHKRDQRMPSLLIKKVLKRLEIPAEEWLSSLKNS